MTPADRAAYTATALVVVLLVAAIISAMLSMVPALQELAGR